MRKIWALGLALSVLLLPSVASAATIQFDFANVPFAKIFFPGDGTFGFPNAGPADFQISSSTGTAGDAVSLFGNIDGVYTIGAIDTSIPGVETAPVTGSGTFSISDGVQTLTADLSWGDIFTLGAGGGLNQLGLSANLTNISYGGTNGDLTNLRDSLAAGAVLSFQFIPAVTLTNLKTFAFPGHNTSYSGSVVAQLAPDTVPEPASMLLLGTGLVGLGARLRRRAKKA